MNRSVNVIRTIIVDDEKAARDGICYLLAEDPDIELIASCKYGSDAIIKINKLKPDLVFLDIQMPEIDGFKVLELINPDNMPVIIFVTAYDKYALNAFKVNALDYLLKPFDDDCFYRSLDKAKSYFELSKTSALQKKLLSLFNNGRLNDPALLKEQNKYIHKIRIKHKNEIFFLETDKIDLIVANNDYVIINSGLNKYLLREKLKNLENILFPETFVRIHRCLLININHILTINLKDRLVTTKDERKYKISPTGVENLKKVLSSHTTFK